MNEEITGRDIIDHILDAMEEHAHPLKYRTLVPGLYQVYLRPDDYERLEPLFSEIRADTKRGLDEKLASLNSSRFSLKFNRKPEHINLLKEWYVDFQADVDEEEIPLGEPFAVDLQIALPPEPEYGSGTKTISLKTVRMQDGKPKSVKTSQEQVYARISYCDNTGDQTYLMTKKQIVIGRGGKAHWVDLKLETADDVSRNHLRLLYDDQRKCFFIKDLSLFGTVVNGERIPSSLETVDDVSRETDTKTPLPQTAKIVLAEKLWLDFKSEIN